MRAYFGDEPYYDDSVEIDIQIFGSIVDKLKTKMWILASEEEQEGTVLRLWLSDSGSYFIEHS